MPPSPQLAHWTHEGPPGDGPVHWPVHVWRMGRPVRMISSGPLGGGIGDRSWILNASVHRDYARLDPHAHLDEIASALNLSGPGTGLLTAVDVRNAMTAQDTAVHVVATVGLGYPTLAAAPPDPLAHAGFVPGTINIVAFLPVLLADAALVNAVATATEAKVQALHEQGMAQTGTATDAVVIGCLGDEDPQPYGGPRSVWGSRLARAVHAAVGAGYQRWSERRR